MLWSTTVKDLRCTYRDDEVLGDLPCTLSWNGNRPKTCDATCPCYTAEHLTPLNTPLVVEEQLRVRYPHTLLYVVCSIAATFLAARIF